MHLFHYTSVQNLRGIGRHGLTVGDVPTDLSRLSGKCAVWLTTSDTPKGHGLEGSAQNKSAFRLTVDVPETSQLVSWNDWSQVNATAITRASLAAANGESCESWFLFFGQIEPSRVVEVRHTETGEVFDDWQTLWPENLSNTGVPYWRRHSWHKRLLRDVSKAMQARAKTVKVAA